MYYHGEEKVPLKVNKNSWLVAAFIFETLLCKIVNVFVRIPYISVWLMLLIMLSLFVINKQFKRTSLNRSFTGYLIVFLVLLISSLLNGFENTANYFVYFLVFGTTALFVTSVEFDYKKVIFHLLQLSIIYSIVYFLFERGSFIDSDSYWNSQMGLAYGFLIPVVSGMVAICYKDIFRFGFGGKLMSWLSVIIGIYVIFLDCGTRGAMVAVVVTVGLLFFEKEKNIKRAILFVIFVILGVVFFNNLESIIFEIYQFLSSHGIDIPALTKMVWMMQRNIADNGRNEIYEMGLEIFHKNPILGSGVGYFESLAGGYYVHNIFLQLLCEVGIIGFLCVISLMIKNFIIVFLSYSLEREERAFHILLFLITVPLLIFSSSYWLLPSFWMYFWMLLRTMRVKKRKLVRVQIPEPNNFVKR